MKHIVWISIVVATGLYICGPIVDPDLWWHLTFGRWIVAHQEIPVVDHWNMWGAGKPWQAYSWSNEIIFYLLDHWFGIQGLMAGKMALGVILAASLFYCFGKLADDWFVGALLGIFATCACHNHFTLRPQTLVWCYLVWLIFWVDRIDREGATVKNLLPFCAILTIWANTHITTALGLFLTGCWLFDFSRERILLTARVLAAGFVATLFTPYMGREWLTTISKTGHPFAHSSVAEFQPATIMQFSTGFLILVLVLLLAFLHLQPRKLSHTKLIAGGAFVMAALAVVKFIPFGVIVLSALTARIWRDFRADPQALGNLAQAIREFKAVFDKFPKEGLSFVFLCLAVVNAHKAWQEPVSEDIVPVEAVDFMIEKKLPHPILNDFGRGGYIMYRYSDERGVLENLVPIDGRTNVTPYEVWEKFHASLFGKLNWREYIDLVKPQTILWRTESALSAIFLAGDEWCLVKRTGDDDAGYMVFVTAEYFKTHMNGVQSLNCSADSAADTKDERGFDPGEVSKT